MEMIFVKPAEGGRVRQPERAMRVMPIEGAWVPRDPHYERLLATGDVLEAPAPDKAAAVPDKPEPETNAGKSRRASADQKEK